MFTLTYYFNLDKRNLSQGARASYSNKRKYEQNKTTRYLEGKFRQTQDEFPFSKLIRYSMLYDPSLGVLFIMYVGSGTSISLQGQQPNRQHNNQEVSPMSLACTNSPA